ncbi:MAG: hypothetical protein KKF50_00835 [Nanoarchaeota archaeon]|nr:hypothetical protein [Nanoarchaeota archaeon]
MRRNQKGISLAEVVHGRKILFPDAEIEVYQLASRFGHIARQWLVFANDDYFVVQSSGEFNLYEMGRFSYKLINKDLNKVSSLQQSF